MKKISFLFITFLLCISITSCGSSNKSEYDPSEGNVLITENMIAEIKDVVLENGEYGDLSLSFEFDALNAANARAGAGVYDNIKEFTSIEITSEDYHDDWHYNFYGKIYGKDNYNKSVSYDFVITVVCREDSSEECGYSIERDGININI